MTSVTLVFHKNANFSCLRWYIFFKLDVQKVFCFNTINQLDTNALILQSMSQLFKAVTNLDKGNSVCLTVEFFLFHARMHW